MELANKRILMTQPLMEHPMGSSMVTWELCDYMKSMGADIDLYVCCQGSPMIDLPKEIGVNVICNEEADLDLRTYDLIWIHSQILPHKCIAQLTDTEGLPQFVFNHMSSLMHDELPWIPEFESRFASLTVCVSELAANVVRSMLPDDIPVVVMNNPVPTKYCEYGSYPKGELERVLVVSNHITDEVSQACNLLQNEGIVVEHAGQGGDFSCPMTPELLSGYDSVITIGKTAQYCMVMGIPVFIYDHFGGFGYLNDDNYDLAKSSHFSGRIKGERMTSSRIAEVIISQYDKALEWAQRTRQHHVNEYSIAKVFPSVISQMSNRHAVPLDIYQARIIDHTEGVIHGMFRGFTDRDRIIAKIDADLHARHADIEELQATIEDNNKVIARIDGDLSSRDAIIARIDNDLQARHADIDELQRTISDNNRVIAKQAEQLKRLRKELKAAKNPPSILERGISYIRRRM